MTTTELIFSLVKKHPGLEISIGYNEEYDWFEIYMFHGSARIVRMIPSWLSEMYSEETVNRTIQAAVEELVAGIGGEKNGREKEKRYD